METGQDVLLVVEQEQKLEPGLVQTQLQLMVVLIVLGRRLRVRTATNTSAQVKMHILTTCSIWINFEVVFFQSLSGAT